MGEGSNNYRAALYVVAVVGAVLAAAIVAPSVWNAVQSTSEQTGDESQVTVLTLRGGTNAANVNAISDQLREARNNPATEAVVLRVDSPGGPVTSSSEFYLAVNRTAAEMPVVAYVEGSAASGGYYGIAPADAIYVKPASTVGSIGVIVQAPLSTIRQSAETQDAVLRTGPDKAQVSVDGLRQDLETLQNSFVNTVMRHRGDELALTRQQVSNGSTYLGGQAVENGFADEIGTVESAVAEAADRADGIEGENYDVRYRELPQLDLGLGLLAGAEEVERVNGSVVYVDASDADAGASEEFARPEFYAVWGVPADSVNDTEVIRNGS